MHAYRFSARCPYPVDIVPRSKERKTSVRPVSNPKFFSDPIYYTCSGANTKGEIHTKRQEGTLRNDNNNNWYTCLKCGCVYYVCDNPWGVFLYQYYGLEQNLVFPEPETFFRWRIWNLFRGLTPICTAGQKKTLYTYF